ncbi:MAG TPA: DinB family protein [Ardenticatenaceae bacterium]|nr:DinB family protein [Ardenticatenaceae bacterium]
MYDTNRELVEALAATPDVLEALLHGLSQEPARALRGGDEHWSILEVICHLRDAEEFALRRMRTMRDEPEPPISGYDQAAWARERNYAAADLHAAFLAFQGFRAQHLAELAALAPEQWQRLGRHDKHGAVTILNHSQHTLWHDAVHTAQIARQLR